MFELVVRTVLNKFLGDYVSNLESNQLNVGLFSGMSLSLLEVFGIFRKCCAEWP